MTSFGDLLGPQPTLLPGDEDAESLLLNHEAPEKVAAAHPTASIAWAYLAEAAFEDGKVITAYAYARTGYHRGLDQLRRNGWKGFGSVPYSHEPNRGFLRCVAVLAKASRDIGENDEYARCLDLLEDCDPNAAAELDSAKARLEAGAKRLRLSLLPILQCALAAGLAWLVAKDGVGHSAPFFAPVAAVVSLGVSLGARLRRSAELVAGVTVGIGVGDAIISVIGTGPWQIGLVVFLALATTVLLDGGPIISMQAGSSAVLVATLLPPGNSGGFNRMVDALIGGLVGIAVVALIPTHPIFRARKDAASILGTASAVLQLVADGLIANDQRPIVDALKKARATQGAIDTLRTDIKGGREIARISPVFWNTRPRLAQLARTADPLDNAIRNIRVLARRSLSLVRDDEILDPRLVDEVEKLAQATDVLRRMVLADPGKQPDGAEAARVLRTVASGARPELIQNAGLSATVVLAQIRSILVDLLQVAGLSRISAIATLPPTVDKPGVTPDVL